MQVNLSPHSAQIVQSALARGLGRSPEEVVERALETIAGKDAVLSEEKKNAGARPLMPCTPSARSIISR